MRRNAQFEKWNTQFARWASIAAISAGCIGCKVGPDFKSPDAVVRSEWNLAYHPRLQAEAAQLDNWWIHFNDPMLEHLIHQTLSQNMSIRAAAARIEEAKARRGVTAGNLYPQFQALNGSYAATRISSNTANFFSFPSVFEPDLTPEAWQVGFATSWELDFWGKYRRSIEAADAGLLATIASSNEAKVLLTAALAQTYVEMRTAESRLELAKRNLEIQQKTLDIAFDKQEAGLGSGLDVDQAKINVGQTTAVIPLLEISRLQASHRLCVLMGRPPIDLAPEIGYTAVIPDPPTALAFGIPADLLRRRPDVRRAEAELAIQSAKIGIAQTDFYPHISLNGNIGYAAEDFGKLFDRRSDVALISPGFSWNLLNYGRIKNNVAAEKAAFQALCMTYQNSVLAAAQEAEDAQVAFVLGHDRVTALQYASQSAIEAVEKSESLYKEGTVDFGRVYILQAVAVEQQDQLAVAKGQVSVSLIQLFKALGGGWRAHCPTVILPNEVYLTNQIDQPTEVASIDPSLAR